MTNTPTSRIDAHHHLWRYTQAEDADFKWIDDSMATLRRDFLPNDLRKALRSANIDAAIAVQARQSLEETSWLLECAEATPAICAVVGWAPLAADDLSTTLDRFSNRKKLVGYREIVQSEPDGYLDHPSFNRGIAQLTARDYIYDLLIHQHQLEEATRLVDHHSQQRFILDHAAKPRIAASELEPWATNIRELARRDNVSCKISGLVTEADWSHWTTDALRPYLDICVEAFGAQRLLAGSDWPVCLVASTYPRWWTLLERYFAAFTAHEQQRIFGLNAIDIYRIPPSLSGASL
jgi:L-fuconolactonase